MARKRVVRTYTDTRAKGDRTPIKGNRFFLRVDLVSLKVEEQTDFGFDRTAEVYMRVGGSLIERSRRTPVEGVIKIEINEVFKPRDGLNLYSDFIEDDDGKSVDLNFRVFDKDATIDDHLVSTKLSITLGQDRDYLSFRENGIKIKIALSANPTRF